MEASCKKWSMKVNPDKCEIISAEADNMQTDSSIVEKVERFIFLGSVVPGSTSDIRRRIGLASSAFGQHNKKNKDSQRHPNKTKNPPLLCFNHPCSCICQ